MKPEIFAEDVSKLLKEIGAYIFVSKDKQKIFSFKTEPGRDKRESSINCRGTFSLLIEPFAFAISNY